MAAKLKSRLAVVSVLSADEAHAVERAWNKAFAKRVRKRFGVDIYHGYKWHTFTWCETPCREGQDALAAHQQQRQAEFFVFDEKLPFCLACGKQPYPDLSDLRDDLYVAHQNMKWTMVFTHEQPTLGPYFAEKAKV